MRKRSKSRTKRPERQVNWLELRPVRLRDWKEYKGRVVLIAPRFRSEFGFKMARLLRMKPNFHIRLDTYGSQVWNLMEGDLSVGALAQRLGELYGNEVEPLHDRLEEFLFMLEANEFIAYHDAPAKEEE